MPHEKRVSFKWVSTHTLAEPIICVLPTILFCRYNSKFTFAFGWLKWGFEIEVKK